MPLKLRYGSRLPLRCLQKWLENQCQSWVASKPPRSIGTNIQRDKTIRAPYEDTRDKVFNNTIKTYATSSKSYITHNRGRQTLENHDSECLKCGSEHQDSDKRFWTTKLWLWMPVGGMALKAYEWMWLWTPIREMTLNAHENDGYECLWL